jgi:hypothetical protein
MSPLSTPKQSSVSVYNEYLIPVIVIISEDDKTDFSRYTCNGRWGRKITINS